MPEYILEGSLSPELQQIVSEMQTFQNKLLSDIINKEDEMLRSALEKHLGRVADDNDIRNCTMAYHPASSVVATVYTLFYKKEIVGIMTKIFEGLKLTITFTPKTK